MSGGDLPGWLRPETGRAHSGIGKGGKSHGRCRTERAGATGETNGSAYVNSSATSAAGNDRIQERSTDRCGHSVAGRAVEGGHNSRTATRIAGRDGRSHVRYLRTRSKGRCKGTASGQGIRAVTECAVVPASGRWSSMRPWTSIGNWFCDIAASGDRSRSGCMHKRKGALHKASVDPTLRSWLACVQ